ncbi:MAG: isopenicillin N synthase family oxygenase [Alphaproteobacteria bacterium]|nr:isopenicillin N synthase family oxygenase [Alphaproteobacteria bacterium]
MDDIPIIDVSRALTGDAASKGAVAGAIDRACRDTGFFSVVGHGVPMDLVQSTRAMAVAFFAQPDAEKMKVERPPTKISRGYFKFKDRSLSYSLGIAAPPDVQEAYALGREVAGDAAYRSGDLGQAMLARNIWPEHPAGFRAQMLAYYAAMSDLGDRMMWILAHALDVPESFFDDKFDRHPSHVRLIRYPKQDATPEPGQLRAGAHTDYGTLTFVRGDPVPGGLEVKRLDGGWTEVRCPAEGFVVNIGDLMARWTNDRWVSTLHRVGNPPPGTVHGDRISLVFFQMPNQDAVIRCIPTCAGAGEKYPPITTAEHYLGKVMKAAHARLDATEEDARVATS